MLVFSSGDTLPPEGNEKHLRVARRKKLEDNALWMFRHVTEFKLHDVSEDNHRYFAQGKSDVIKNTLSI